MGKLQTARWKNAFIYSIAGSESNLISVFSPYSKYYLPFFILLLILHLTNTTIRILYIDVYLPHPHDHPRIAAEPLFNLSICIHPPDRPHPYLSVFIRIHLYSSSSSSSTFPPPPSLSYTSPTHMTVLELQRSPYSLWGRLHRGSGSMELPSEWIDWPCDHDDDHDDGNA